jgi:hypothetical protein
LITPNENTTSNPTRTLHIQRLSRLLLSHASTRAPRGTSTAATRPEETQSGVPQPQTQIKRRTRNWGHGLAVYMVLTENLGVIPPGHDTRRTAVQLHHWREIAAVSGRACPQLQRCTSESFAAVCSGDNLPPLPLYSSTRMQYALSPSYMRLCSVPTRR